MRPTPPFPRQAPRSWRWVHRRPRVEGAEDQLLPVAPAADVAAALKRYRRGVCSWVCGTPRRAAICGAKALALALALGVPLGLCVVLPRLAGALVRASTLTLLSASLGPARADGIEAVMLLRLDNAGPFGATLRAFDASFHGPAGSGETDVEPLGSLRFPDTPIGASAVTIVSLKTLLRVSSATAFRAATALVLAGEAAAWEVRGETSVSVFGISVAVSLRKQLTMPPTKSHVVSIVDAPRQSNRGLAWQCSQRHFSLPIDDPACTPAQLRACAPSTSTSWAATTRRAC